jgi:hypothetical protein
MYVVVDTTPNPISLLTPQRTPYRSQIKMAQQSSRTAVAAVFLVALVVLAAAASLPAASAYGCYDDCYERCANGKQDPDCNNMCTQACSVNAAAVDANKPAA